MTFIAPLTGPGEAGVKPTSTRHEEPPARDAPQVVPATLNGADALMAEIEIARTAGLASVKVPGVALDWPTITEPMSMLGGVMVGGGPLTPVPFSTAVAPPGL